MAQFPLAFLPLRRDLYRPFELLSGFVPGDPASFGNTDDFDIYKQYVASGGRNAKDFSMSMMQAIHDNSITSALEDFLSQSEKTVGIMGDHAMERGSTVYRDVAHMARSLARAGLTVVSGGGPGAME